MRSSISRKVGLVWGAFGARGLVRRATYVAALRSGFLRRRLPATTYDSWSGAPWHHRFDLDDLRRRYEEGGLTTTAAADAIAQCELVLSGRLPFYGGASRTIGFPPRWRALPDGGPELPATHWTAGSDDLADGDIKDVWEPSRFGFTFAFARAYVTGGDDRWVESWWQLFEDWVRENPPNIGPNWRCGQESSLRAIAVCFGLSTFGSHPASTPERLASARRFLAVTRARVEPTVGYALSQRNNHAISELVFLTSLPGGATRHRQRLLRKALRDQWYPDGSYSQQSLVYERLAVHALVWLLHVQPHLDPSTLSAIRSALSAAREFLARLSDPVAGRMPNSGANDGALLFDLDVAERWDARPTLAMLGRTSAHPTESAIWLPPDRLGLGPCTVAASSFVTMTGPRSLLLTHVGQGHHRAGDDDQQAIELIIDGQPVVLDPGTFRYSGRPPWRQPFTGAMAHSMVVRDGPQDTHALGRFLREPMPAATVIRRDPFDDDEVLVTRRHEGPCTITRSILRRGDRFLIVDDVVGGTVTVRWLLPATAVDIVDNAVALPGTTLSFSNTTVPRVVSRSDDDPWSGWWSPLYGERREATMIRVSVADGQVVLTSIAPAGETPLTFADVAPALRTVPELEWVVESMAARPEVTT